jgi:plasmid stability protein
MTTLTIRNLDEHTKAQLRIHAHFARQPFNRRRCPADP